MNNWISPIRDGIAAGLVTIIAAASAWAAAWIRAKVRANEAVNDAILKQSSSNAAQIRVLRELVNGRLSQLLDATAELGNLQAALEHVKGMDNGMSTAVLTPKEAIAQAKLKLVEAASEAKRILAEAATAAKEQMDLLEIQSGRDRLSINPQPPAVPATEQPTDAA